jgi:hypothetical protein
MEVPGIPPLYNTSMLLRLKIDSRQLEGLELNCPSDAPDLVHEGIVGRSRGGKRTRTKIPEGHRHKS